VRRLVIAAFRIFLLRIVTPNLRGGIENDIDTFVAGIKVWKSVDGKSEDRKCTIVLRR